MHHPLVPTFQYLLHHPHGRNICSTYFPGHLTQQSCRLFCPAIVLAFFHHFALIKPYLSNIITDVHSNGKPKLYAIVIPNGISTYIYSQLCAIIGANVCSKLFPNLESITFFLHGDPGVIPNVQPYFLPTAIDTQFVSKH